MPSCPDFKASCVRPTPKSQRLALDGCDSCAGPRCRDAGGSSANTSVAAAVPVRWLHIPKAGSAFVNVLARFACPHDAALPAFDIALNYSQWRAAHPLVTCDGLLPPWAGHAPVQRHEVQSGRRVLVGVFRQPAQRLLSGFHHREDGRANSMIAPGAPPAVRAKMRRACRGDPGAYARWPGIAGCATKMLLGWPCAAERPLVPGDVARAVHVLTHHFAFVGLTEEWPTSVCVFHALLRRGAPVEAAELTRTHPGPLRPAAPRSRRRRSPPPPPPFSYDERALRGFVDAADERVYAAARSRFWADARRTGCTQRSVT